MTRQKDLKRLVRTRMQKTGEAYTTARSQIIRKSRKDVKPTPSAPAPDYAALAGMAEESLIEKTGRNWAQWVAVLDKHKAHELPHRDIAKLVSAEYGVPDWWTQTVTVGYERIKGLRARGQRRDGTYEANKSRTYNVPIDELFDRWADTRQRKRWLKEPLTVRTATALKSMRMGWSDGTIVVVGFMAKGPTKSAVAVQHTKLPDKQTAERMKQYWAERLDALAELL